MAGVAAIVCSCSDQPKDDWYDRSTQITMERDTYIDGQAVLGVDPDEARKLHDMKNFTIITEGRHLGVVREGSDLKENSPGTRGR